MDMDRGKIVLLLLLKNRGLPMLPALEQRTSEEAPRQPAPKVQTVNAEIDDASVLIVERDPGLRKQIWEYPANERD